MIEYKYIHTASGITVVVEGRPYNVSAEREDYSSIVDAVLTGAPPQKVLALIEAKSRAIRELVSKQLTPNLEYNEGVVLYRGRVLHNRAITRMVEMIKQGLDIQPLARFVEKLMLNPRPQVIDNLYAFMEVGNIPITVDGDFLVYKAVRADYYDIHFGRYLNSVGAKPRMPMEGVDPDRDQTCSHGLHVCSYAYLPSFAHADGHVMMCKVNPTDVGAIPSDYNNTKMRVCGYEVVEEITGYYRRGLDELGTGGLVREERYEVYTQSHSDGEADLYDTFYTLEEAKTQAGALAGNAFVVDKQTGETVSI